MWVFTLAAAAVACLLRVGFADRRGFWLDEYYTLNAAKMSISAMIADRFGAGHSPLYFFYARLGLLFGSSERALRLTSALAAGALVFLLTGLMRELKLKGAIPWMWGLAAILPYWISVGMEYRYTMPLIAVAAGVAWMAAAYAGRVAWRRGVALAALVGLFMWMHGSAPFFAAGLLAFLIWDGFVSTPEISRVTRLKQALAQSWPVLAGLAIGAPFYYLVRNHPSSTPADQVVNAKALLEDLVEVMFCDYKLWFVFLRWKEPVRLFTLECLVLTGGVWLAWRELRRTGNGRAWRLLACTMAAIPLLMFMFCAMVRNFQGPVRYLANFTVPATVCLAVAAGAAVARPHMLRRAWLGGLAVVLAFQGSAALLERGDRHRDAICWLIENHREQDKIVASVTQLNALALKFYGLNKRGVVSSAGGRESSVDAMEARLKKTLKSVRRALYIHYHSNLKILDAMEHLAAEGFFVGHRQWFVGGRLWVGAVIRDTRDAEWLESLEDPRKEWGPAKADDRSD